MPNYSKNSVILVRYPFSDLSATKIRPAVIVNPDSSSQDYFKLSTKDAQTLEASLRLWLGLSSKN